MSCIAPINGASARYGVAYRSLRTDRQQAKRNRGESVAKHSHSWNPCELTATAEAVPSAVVVIVIAVFVELAGIHGLYSRLSVTPVVLEASS